MKKPVPTIWFWSIWNISNTCWVRKCENRVYFTCLQECCNVHSLMRHTEVSDSHKDLWIQWLLGPVVLVQKDTIYAELLSLADKVHEESRTLESLLFCFPVETIPLGTPIMSVLQHSSFVASGWMAVAIRGGSQTSYGSASVFIIFRKAICGMYVKMM